jgi:quercetin dioxygenase-like cupin family protein
MTPEEQDALTTLTAEGLEPTSWGNGPGERYGWHAHDYEKVLVCVGGSIVFHTDDGDLPLGPGDRMELPPGTRHAATVGSTGVRCVEAPR